MCWRMMGVEAQLGAREAEPRVESGQLETPPVVVLSVRAVEWERWGVVEGKDFGREHVVEWPVSRQARQIKGRR